MNRTAVYPGTFDPVTSGHLDIIKRTSKIFDKAIIAITDNSLKKPVFTLDKRSALVKQSIPESLTNIEIDSFNGLLVDFCNRQNANIIIKGLRAVSDFEYEFMMAQMNTRLNKNIETLFMMASPEYAYLSSSAVKEIARYGGSIKGLVPSAVEKALKSHYSVK